MKIFAINKYNSVIYTTGKTAIKSPLNYYMGQNNTQKDYFSYESSIKFTGFKCKQKDFALKKIPDQNCPCCGQKMVTSIQQDEFINHAGCKKGRALQKILNENLQYMHSTEKEISKILINISKQKPDADLSKLVNVASSQTKNQLAAEQIKIIEQMQNKASETCSKKQMRQINAICDTAIQQILQTDDNSNSSKEKNSIQKISSSLIQKLKYLNSQFNNCNELIQTAEELSARKTTQAYFIKYSQKTNKEIARSLIAPSLATTEHIIPVSYNGNDNTGNYLVLCNQCNRKRGDEAYPQWFEQHPEMIDNLQQYINNQVQLINNNAFYMANKYKDYPNDISKLFYKETNGKVKLIVPQDSDYPNLPQNPTKEELSFWTNNYNQILKELDDIKQQLSAKQNEYAITAAILQDFQTDMHSRQKILGKKAKNSNVDAEYYSICDTLDTIKNAQQDLRNKYSSIIKIKNQLESYLKDKTGDIK